MVPLVSSQGVGGGSGVGGSVRGECDGVIQYCYHSRPGAVPPAFPKPQESLFRDGCLGNQSRPGGNPSSFLSLEQRNTVECPRRLEVRAR
jgi:hypothetical protein